MRLNQPVIYNSLLGILDHYSEDGLHVLGAGWKKIASKIIGIIIDNNVSTLKRYYGRNGLVYVFT